MIGSDTDRYIWKILGQTKVIDGKQNTLPPNQVKAKKLLKILEFHSGALNPIF